MQQGDAEFDSLKTVIGSIERLVGMVCTAVNENYPENFTFEFGTAPAGLFLSVDCLWRILGDRRVELTSLDHGHQFGLPAPVDAFDKARKLLCGQRVLSVQLRNGPVDLAFEFEGGRTLELLQQNSGYEPWNLTGPGIHLIATGGGWIADFSPKS